MREPYTQLYLHLVWATWDRLPLITPDLERAIYACIRQECSEMRCDALALGGIEDHVHLLVRFPTTIPVAQLTKQVKGASSHLASHEVDPRSGFKWQGGYGAFTVSKAHVPRVVAYVERQRERHRDEVLDEDLEAIWAPEP